MNAALGNGTGSRHGNSVRLRVLAAASAFFASRGHAVIQTPGDDEAIHAQMEALIGKVELDLHRIDGDLFTAATGRGPTKAEQSGLSELLKKVQADAHQTQSDMQKILELAKSHAHESNCKSGNCVGKKLCSSKGMGSGKKPSNSDQASSKPKDSPLDSAQP